MARKFEAPLRFLTERGIKVWLDEQNRIHLVNDEEHQTLYCSDETPMVQIQLCVGMLEDIAADGPLAYDEAYKMLQLFHQAHGGCIMGDLKPGLLYEYVEEHEPRDPWKDRVTWDAWITEQYIAREYYSREAQRGR